MVKLFQTLFVAILFAGFVGIGETQAQPRYVQELITIRIGGEVLPATRYLTLLPKDGTLSKKPGTYEKISTSYTLSPDNPEIPEKGINKLVITNNPYRILEVMITPKGKIINIKITYPPEPA